MAGFLMEISQMCLFEQEYYSIPHSEGCSWCHVFFSVRLNIFPNSQVQYQKYIALNHYFLFSLEFYFNFCSLSSGLLDSLILLDILVILINTEYYKYQFYKVTFYVGSGLSYLHICEQVVFENLKLLGFITLHLSLTR